MLEFTLAVAVWGVIILFLGLLILFLLIRHVFNHLEQQALTDFGWSQPRFERPQAEVERPKLEAEKPKVKRPKLEVEKPKVEAPADSLTRSTNGAGAQSQKKPRKVIEAPRKMIMATARGMDLDLGNIHRRKQMLAIAQERPEAVARVIHHWLAEGA